jgi:hypothetical protein
MTTYSVTYRDGTRETVRAVTPILAYRAAAASERQHGSVVYVAVSR